MNREHEEVKIWGNAKEIEKHLRATYDFHRGLTCTAYFFSKLSHAIVSSILFYFFFRSTDVLGEFEINNKEPITKIGSGLHPKIKQEKR
jgi:hypothetical protein